MARFWTRTRIFLATVWSAVVLAEFLVFFTLERVDNSWVLLLFAAVLVLPLAAVDVTVRWLRRSPRERWMRYDVAAASTKPRLVVEAPAEPAAQATDSSAELA